MPRKQSTTTENQSPIGTELPAMKRRASARAPVKTVFVLKIFAVGREFEVLFESEQKRKVEVVRFSQRSPRGLPVTIEGFTFIGPVVLEQVER